MHYLQRKKYWVETINEGQSIYFFQLAKTVLYLLFLYKEIFIKVAEGNISGLKNEYQEQPMQKMKAEEF